MTTRTRTIIIIIIILACINTTSTRTYYYWEICTERRFSMRIAVKIGTGLVIGPSESSHISLQSLALMRRQITGWQ